MTGLLEELDVGVQLPGTLVPDCSLVRATLQVLSVTVQCRLMRRVNLQQLHSIMCLLLSGFWWLGLVCGWSSPEGSICKVFSSGKWMIWYNERFCVIPKIISCALHTQYWLQVHLLICKIQQIPVKVRRAWLHFSLMCLWLLLPSKRIGSDYKQPKFKAELLRYGSVLPQTLLLLLV